MIGASKVRLFLAYCLMFLVLAGCKSGNEGGEATGKVTIDGEPVTAGEVVFVSEDGILSSSGFIKGDGTYTVKEPPLGLVKIAIQTESFKTVDSSNGPPKPHPVMKMPDPQVMGSVYKEIPAKYGKVETSGLTVTIKRGQLTHDLKLSRE